LQQTEKEKDAVVVSQKTMVLLLCGGPLALRKIKKFQKKRTSALVPEAKKVGDALTGLGKANFRL
jgi:hypothetical protein